MQNITPIDRARQAPPIPEHDSPGDHDSIDCPRCIAEFWRDVVIVIRARSHRRQRAPQRKAVSRG